MSSRTLEAIRHFHTHHTCMSSVRMCRQIADSTKAAKFEQKLGSHSQVTRMSPLLPYGVDS